MQQDDFRQHFRIDVPEGYVRDLAVWFRNTQPGGKLDLCEIGRPHLAVGGKISLKVRLEDLSAGGMCVSFLSHASLPVKKLLGRWLFVYFKLAAAHDPFGDHLTLFLVTEIIGANDWKGKTYLSLRIAANGVPDPFEKSLHLIDAAKYGIAELTRWCDEMDRTAVGLAERPQQRGLDLEHLLLEIATHHDEVCVEPAEKAQPPA
jgi:hypothetical protein